MIEGILIPLIVVGLAEFGDKTQIASGLFATRYDGLMVLTGVMIALTLLSVMAIYFGKFITSKIEEKTITKIAGILFIIVGMMFFLI